MLAEGDAAVADTTTTETPATAGDVATKLDQLKASAMQQYSLKNYEAAADFYSEAAEVQEELNGEMSPENAELLYQYGRCLYHVAVSKSDVLGGKVASTEEPKRKKRKVAKAEDSGAGEGSSAGVIGDAMKDGEQKLAEDVVEAAVEEKESVKKENDVASKPFFQITGDENWTDSEDEAEANAEAEEEEDDFATAFEILDLARVLLGKKLEALQADAGKETTEKLEERQLKEKLADTHDLQAEISLENERFHDAIKDTRDALALKLQLYPEESSLIAEAHFKLSLALELASVTSTAEDGDTEAQVAQVDEEMRKEAALEMEKAIASCKLRLVKESAPVATENSHQDGSAQRVAKEKAIADVEDMIADMQQRLVDIRNPAVSLSGGGSVAGPDGSDPLRGVLGAMLGESKVEQQKRIAEATEKANDLSGLVKHRKKAKVENGAEVAVDGKGKRRAEDGDVGEGANGKKVKFEGGA